MFLTELKNFSKQNWWIFVILAISLIIVGITGKGNILSIFILFFANFLGNLFIMVMQANYSAGNNKIGAIYHICSTLTFTAISIYGLIYEDKFQYIIWQISYLIAALKALSFYVFNKNFKFINEIFLGIFNVILIAGFLYFGLKGQIFGQQINLNIGYESIIMALGFSFVTTGLVSTRDKFRYWASLIGVTFITLGSLIGVINGYFAGKVDGVSLGYFILTMTTGIFYFKLLKNYLK